MTVFFFFFSFSNVSAATTTPTQVQTQAWMTRFRGPKLLPIEEALRTTFFGRLADKMRLHLGKLIEKHKAACQSRYTASQNEDGTYWCQCRFYNERRVPCGHVLMKMHQDFPDDKA